MLFHCNLSARFAESADSQRILRIETTVVDDNERRRHPGR